MSDYDMCQFNKDSVCPNAVSLGENVASIKQYVKEMKDMTVAAQLETRVEIKDIHKRIDALIYWVAGLSITNIIAFVGFIIQFFLSSK
jgi:hypothetical protein